jgi:O-acetyl-ADP-ribose deacetylase (regulator of RNase III)
MGAGVAGAVNRKGGEVIEREAVAKGPIAVGDAVITTAGDLAARHVIHAAGMGQDLKTDEDLVKKATHSSLSLAEENEWTSVAFPAIGCGVGGLSAHRCARAMLGEVVEFLQESEFLRKVVFVLFDDGTYRIFQERLAEIFSAGEHS